MNHGLRILAMNEIEAAGLLEQQLTLRNITRIPAAIQATLPARPVIFENRGDIGVIRISGPLFAERDAEYDFFGASYTTYDQVQQAAGQLAGDETVRGVLLAIDSPGGDAIGVSAAAEALAALAARKPTAAWTGRMMASAAYFLGSQAGRITASIDALVGSIGTVMVLPDLSAMLNRLGIGIDIFRTGPLKYTGNGLEKLSDTQRQYLQSTVDGYGAIFKAAVARGRRRSADWVDSVASGRTWLGQQAVENGLIDGVGSLEDAVNALRAGLPPLIKLPRNAASEASMNPQEPQTNGAERPAGTVQAAPAAPAGTAPTPAPAAVAAAGATLAEIKAGCPGASDAFLVSCIERGATVEQARSEWMTKLAADNEMLRTRTSANATTAQAPKGGAAVAFAPAAPVASASADDEEGLKAEYERMTPAERSEYGGAREYAHYRKALAAGKVTFAGK